MTNLIIRMEDEESKLKYEFLGKKSPFSFGKRQLQHGWIHLQIGVMRMNRSRIKMKFKANE